MSDKSRNNENLTDRENDKSGNLGVEKIQHKS